MKIIITQMEVTIHLSGVEEPVVVPYSAGTLVWDQITKGGDAIYEDYGEEGKFLVYIPHDAIAMATARSHTSQSEVVDDNCNDGEDPSPTPPPPNPDIT